MGKFYHGTNMPSFIILDEGLLPGDNSTGGTHGTYDPRVCLTEYFSVAQKYGQFIYIITIDESELETNTDRDGLFYFTRNAISAEQIQEESDFDIIPEFSHDLE